MLNRHILHNTSFYTCISACSHCVMHVRFYRNVSVRKGEKERKREKNKEINNDLIQEFANSLISVN